MIVKIVFEIHSCENLNWQNENLAYNEIQND